MTRDEFIILLVDDDPNQLLFLNRAFSKVNSGKPPVLMACRDGEEAIAYLAGDGLFADRSAHPMPGLVLLDLKLPKKGGLDVLAWIRRSPHVKSMPVIVLTGSAEPSDLERASTLGATSYLVKPLEFAGLLEIARNLMALREELMRPPGR